MQNCKEARSWNTMTESGDEGASKPVKFCTIKNVSFSPEKTIVLKGDAY